jgi:hypothetical protein
MTHRTILAAAVFAALGCSAATLAGPEPSLAGRWQYLQPPDKEGEVLDLSVSAGRWRGVLNGLERAGEHGLYYFVVEVEEFAVETDGTMRFEVGERKLSRRRPPLSQLTGEGDDGVTRYRMRFTGRLEGEDLVLRCEDGDTGSCPDRILRFKRIAGPDNGEAR